MRKLFAILCFCGLAFLTGGYFLLYQLRLSEIKTAVRADLRRANKNSLTKLTFSVVEAAALVWEDENEFQLNGEMYDVVQTESDGTNTITYWCLPDDKETALINQYLKAHSSGSDKDASHSLFKLLSLPFLPVTAPGYGVCFVAGPLRSSPFLFMLPSSARNVLTPPPKVC